MNTKKITEKLEWLIKNDDTLSPEIKLVIEQAREKIEKAKTKEELVEALAIILSLLEIGIKLIDIIQT